MNPREVAAGVMIRRLVTEEDDVQRVLSKAEQTEGRGLTAEQQYKTISRESEASVH